MREYLIWNESILNSVSRTKEKPKCGGSFKAIVLNRKIRISFGGRRIEIAVISIRSKKRFCLWTIVVGLWILPNDFMKLINIKKRKRKKKMEKWRYKNLRLFQFIAKNAICLYVLYIYALFCESRGPVVELLLVMQTLQDRIQWILFFYRISWTPFFPQDIWIPKTIIIIIFFDFFFFTGSILKKYAALV